MSIVDPHANRHIFDGNCSRKLEKLTRNFKQHFLQALQIQQNSLEICRSLTSSNHISAKNTVFQALSRPFPLILITLFKFGEKLVERRTWARRCNADAAMTITCRSASTGNGTDFAYPNWHSKTDRNISTRRGRLPISKQ